MQIENNNVVSLRYVMRNATGEVMEDNTSGAPFEYLHGNGNLLSLLETAIAGLSAGDKKNISFADKQLGSVFYFDV
ncbi:MAG: FKBP-type peptidyl-prolyl cis-trans isomerase, partial [Ginsengibacter sp.]